MQEVYVKLSEFETMEEIHEYLAEHLNFPEYYGKNLSALYDVLTDLREAVTITLDLSAGVPESLAEQVEALLDVFCDAAEESDYLEIEIVELVGYM